MRIDILSLFPNMFQATMGESIIGKAQDNGFIDINVTDFRQYTTDKHNHVDDAQFLTLWMQFMNKLKISIQRDGLF